MFLLVDLLERISPEKGHLNCAHPGPRRAETGGKVTVFVLAKLLSASPGERLRQLCASGPIEGVRTNGRPSQVWGRLVGAEVDLIEPGLFEWINATKEHPGAT